MMMVILIVDGELMDLIEMMVDNQADLMVHMEVDEVTKELEKMDQEQDEGFIIIATVSDLSHPAPSPPSSSPW